MSGIVPALVPLIPIVVFSFGSVCFLMLASFYWRVPGRRTSPFGWFSVACAGAFLANLGSALLLFDGQSLDVLQSVCAGMLPPLMLHVVLDLSSVNDSTASRRFWMMLLLTAYVAAFTVALLRGIQPSDQIDIGAGFALAAISGLAIIRLRLHAVATAERRCLIIIFSALFVCTAADLIGASPAFVIAPDYLVLAFFAVRLYYAERLLFFDVFLKGGAYFAAGLAAVTIAVAIITAVSARFSEGDRLWISALLSMPVWLMAPLTRRTLSEWVDRRLLRRRYSGTAAEALFSRAVQNRGTEQELVEQAEEALRLIFDCPVHVELHGAPESLRPGDVAVPVVGDGSVRLQAGNRPSPFLSGELRLLNALALILGSSLHSLQLRSLREEQRAREQALRTLTTQAELRALRAQINPHFLFNALNAVAGCIRTRPELADETLGELAQVFRYTLTRSDKEWVRFGDELDFVQSYLAVEKTRFGDRLRVSIEADRAANSAIVPAMILQPVVENAIKHGTSRLMSVGEVRISAVVSVSHVLTITVSDNGPGFPAVLTSSNLDGHGLRSVAERLRLHYGACGRLQWQRGAERTAVTIELPAEEVRACVC